MRHHFFMALFAFVCVPAVSGAAWAQGAVPVEAKATAAALAQDTTEETLPEVDVLSCGQQCARFVSAKPVFRPGPEYPSGERTANGFRNEGYVLVRYTVDIQGKVRDVTPVYLVGSRNFLNAVIEKVRTWTFQPATSNGKPVEESAYYATSFNGGQVGRHEQRDMRRSVQDVYNAASDLLKAGKSDEARVMLTEAFDKPQMNHLERGLLALPLTRLAMQRKDYLEVRRVAMAATISSKGWLDPQARRITGGAMVTGTGWLQPEAAQELLQLRISADLVLGEMSDAMSAFAVLKRFKGFDEGSSFANLVRGAQDKAGALPQLVVQGRVPRQDEGGAYWHYLSRRTFAFAGINGTLDSLVLGCAGGMIEPQITPTSQWRVPKSWGKCSVTVRGAPGTTFSLVEMNEEVPPPPAR